LAWPALPPSGFSLIPLGTNFAGHVTVPWLVVVSLFFLSAGLYVFGLYKTRSMQASVSPRQIQITPNGVVVWANNNAVRIVLGVFSCVPARLLYLEASIGTKDGDAITFASSDPVRLTAGQRTERALEQTHITTEQMNAVRANGVGLAVSVRGFAKFDGDVRVDFQFATIPSL
jgi:hypothetical protein